MINRYPCLQAMLAACLLIFPTLSHAFKIDTHLWIGQQVINDLDDDGMITVKLKDKSVTLPVPVDVKNAILSNRNEYLIGNIGPDALPDVVVGQTLVHPGSSTGWKTNDWLTFLLAKSQGNPLGTAFAYGYLGHASADVFAHTYVNQYAGDIFELADETLVEQRHVALESFISRFNPSFVNATGQNLGAPYTLVQPGDGVANFVRDVLIYDDQAATQNANGSYSKHLAAYRNYRNKILAAADSSLWQKIDEAVLQAVAAYYGYAISESEANALIDFLNNEVIPQVQQHIDLNQEQVNKLNAAMDRFDAAHFGALNDALRQVMDIHSTIATKLAEKSVQAAKLCTKVTKTIEVTCPRVPYPCPTWSNPFKTCWTSEPGCVAGAKLIEETVCPLGEAAAQTAADLITAIDAELNNTGGLYDQLLQSANQLHEKAVAAKNNSLDIAQRLIDLGQVVSSNTSPAKALLTNWVSDLDVAMAEYVKAATNSMINTMNPASSALAHGSITPMFDWWDCYHLTLVGVPAPVGTGSCGFRGSVEGTLESLQSIAQIIEDATSLATPVNSYVGLPTPAEIRAEVERLKNEAIQQLQDAAVNALIDMLPQEVQDIIAVLGEDMTEERLRYYFTKAETGSAKGLLMIGDVDQRVKTEMQLTASNTYDPERFAVVYNAVVLAKLALLDNAGLNLLAQEAGISYAANGSALFAGTDNVVSNAFASIDGNHQWMPIAPPRPNAMGAPYQRVDLGSGYPSPDGYASAAGFVPWKQEARNALFRSLFIGSLSPGIEAPSEISMPEVLSSDYSYRPCHAYPFPNDENDKTCAAIKVIPVILQLLLED